MDEFEVLFHQPTPVGMPEYLTCARLVHGSTAQGDPALRIQEPYIQWGPYPQS